MVRPIAGKIIRSMSQFEDEPMELGQKEAQIELAHANRVVTVEHLSASIVHEIKQPIAATAVNAQAALRWLDAQPPDLGQVRQALTRIVRDANRASGLINGLRVMAQKAPSRADSVDMNAAVLEITALVQGEATKMGVSIETRLAEGLPLVRGDRIQLQQAILNLVVNALEAMRVIGTGPRQLLVGTARASDDVLVQVGDSGPGLPPDNVERLFEAFYTTKPNGLGMGLSICRSIVDQHRGRLWATDNSPHGALFQFTVPVGGDDAS
jgi:C4-dicarboxylate-specific signal transduction histidine kinase